MPPSVPGVFGLSQVFSGSRRRRSLGRAAHDAVDGGRCFTIFRIFPGFTGFFHSAAPAAGGVLVRESSLAPTLPGTSSRDGQDGSPAIRGARPLTSVDDVKGRWESRTSGRHHSREADRLRVELVILEQAPGVRR